jgi:alkylation response protein AidB-like acyl-CoA dehydrogenase
MVEYAAPITDMKFVMQDVLGLEEIAALPGLEVAETDLVNQILEEAGKFAGNVLSPLNTIGDQQGARIENGVVRTADGFADAYKQFSEAGWCSVPFNPEYGGQGLPWLVQTALFEMWTAANMSFSLCPFLTGAVVDALQRQGSQEQKDTYMSKLISGEWTGTMNMTEPQSGTDLGSIRTRAVHDGENYRIKGQKTFISWGDHDVADNVISMVLARSPDGPVGSRGLSLFIVPKFMVNADGSLGARNDVRPVSLEHKLGIHASPTCIMAYGEEDGAIGFLVGEENRGLEYMFILMNNARLGVGLEGVAIADRAYQQAVAYAKERVQGRPVQGGEAGATIIQHPDVRRMLLDMKSRVEAMRALTYLAAAGIDHADHNTDAELATRSQRMVELLIPVVKAWSTDTAVEIASTNIQIHGGMGFMEETGAAQHYRDARITPIYEGANGVQAMDLLGRKLVRDGGAAAREFIEWARQTLEPLKASGSADLAVVERHLSSALDALAQATEWQVATFGANPAQAATGSVPYLKLMGITAGGWMLARSALVAQKKAANANGDARFLAAKPVTARFFAEHHLSQASGLLCAITEGGEMAMAIGDDQF